MTNKQSHIFRRVISSFVMMTFITSLILPPNFVHAQALELPAPGAMLPLSSAFIPPVLKGLKVYPDKPFNFDFIIDSGDKNLAESEVKEEGTKLIKYFLASLTVPEDDLWVNLSPTEKDRVIPDAFGQTEMGRDLLAEDYILKQLTASLMYPENELGKNFWDTIYNKANELYGTTDVPVNTFNKVWILPDRASVYENGETVFVTETHLKVMLDIDYEAKNTAKIASSQAPPNDDKNQMTTKIIREIILPAIEKEVNEGKNFAQLRQIYYSMILATWYKQNLQNSIINQTYVDQNKINGVNTDDPQIKEKIYNQYLEAFKKGVYDYVKEEYDPATQEVIPRKYFSGGAVMRVAKILTTETNPDAAQLSGKSYVISGFMKEIGLGNDTDKEEGGLTHLHADFEKIVETQNTPPEEIESGIRAFIGNKTINAKVIYDDRLGQAASYHFHSSKLNSHIIVINKSLPKNIHAEAKFHEATEIVLWNPAKFKDELWKSARARHIIASALQRQEFAVPGFLTDYDEFQLKGKSLEELETLKYEYEHGLRDFHKKVIAAAHTKLDYLKETGNDLYEQNFQDRVNELIKERKAQGKISQTLTHLPILRNAPTSSGMEQEDFDQHYTNLVLHFENMILPKAKFQDDEIKKLAFEAYIALINAGVLHSKDGGEGYIGYENKLKLLTDMIIDISFLPGSNENYRALKYFGLVMASGSFNEKFVNMDGLKKIAEKFPHHIGFFFQNAYLSSSLITFFNLQTSGTNFLQEILNAENEETSEALPINHDLSKQLKLIQMIIDELVKANKNVSLSETPYELVVKEFGSNEVLVAIPKVPGSWVNIFIKDQTLADKISDSLPPEYLQKTSKSHFGGFTSRIEVLMLDKTESTAEDSPMLTTPPKKGLNGKLSSFVEGLSSELKKEYGKGVKFETLDDLYHIIDSNNNEIAAVFEDSFGSTVIELTAIQDAQFWEIINKLYSTEYEIEIIGTDQKLIILTPKNTPSLISLAKKILAFLETKNNESLHVEVTVPDLVADPELNPKKLNYFISEVEGDNKAKVSIVQDKNGDKMILAIDKKYEKEVFDLIDDAGWEVLELKDIWPGMLTLEISLSGEIEALMNTVESASIDWSNPEKIADFLVSTLNGKEKGVKASHHENTISIVAQGKTIFTILKNPNNGIATIMVREDFVDFFHSLIPIGIQAKFAGKMGPFPAFNIFEAQTPTSVAQDSEISPEDLMTSLLEELDELFSSEAYFLQKKGSEIHAASIKDPSSAVIKISKVPGSQKSLLCSFQDINGFEELLHKLLPDAVFKNLGKLIDPGYTQLLISFPEKEQKAAQIQEPAVDWGDALSIADWFWHKWGGAEKGFNLADFPGEIVLMKDGAGVMTFKTKKGSVVSLQVLNEQILNNLKLIIPPEIKYIVKPISDGYQFQVDILNPEIIKAGDFNVTPEKFMNSLVVALNQNSPGNYYFDEDKNEWKIFSKDPSSPMITIPKKTIAPLKSFHLYIKDYKKYQDMIKLLLPQDTVIEDLGDGGLGYHHLKITLPSTEQKKPAVQPKIDLTPSAVANQIYTHLEKDAKDEYVIVPVGAQGTTVFTIFDELTKTPIAQVKNAEELGNGKYSILIRCNGSHKNEFIKLFESQFDVKVVVDVGASHKFGPVYILLGEKKTQGKVKSKPANLSPSFNWPSIGQEQLKKFLKKGLEASEQTNIISSLNSFFDKEINNSLFGPIILNILDKENNIQPLPKKSGHSGMMLTGPWETSDAKPVLDWTKAKLLASKHLYNKPMTASAFSLNGKLVVAGFEDGMFLGYASETNKIIFALLAAEMNTAPIAAIGFTIDYEKIIIVTKKGLVEIWDTQSNTRTFNQETGLTNVKEVRYTKDNKIILLTEDGQIWQMSPGQDLSPSAFSPPENTKIKYFSPDGKYLALNTSDGMVTIVDLSRDTPQTIFYEQLSDKAFDLIKVSPDGKFMVTVQGAPDGIGSQVQILDIKTKNELIDTLYTLSPIKTLSISSDGKYVAIGESNGEVSISDVNAGKFLKTPIKIPNLSGLSFTDGNQLIAYDDKGEFSVFSALQPSGGLGFLVSGVGGASFPKPPMAAPNPIPPKPTSSDKKVSVKTFDLNKPQEDQKYDYYEYSPQAGGFIAVNYSVEDPGKFPTPNKAIQQISSDMKRFRKLNNEVLTLLNKPDKTVGEFLDMIDRMEKMVRVYLYLFKGQKEDESLEKIAMSSEDLVGGRTIAQVFLRLSTSLKQNLKNNHPNITNDQPLPEAINEKLEIYDGQKTSDLIVKGAESYSQSEMDGITFAELINIVHQKGNRNITTLWKQIKGEKHSFKVMVRSPLTGTNLKEASSFIKANTMKELTIGYYDSRVKPKTKVAAPLEYIARAFLKGQIVHSNEDLFNSGKVAIIADETEAIMDLKLGHPLVGHTAGVDFVLMPVQEGGGVFVNYTDSGKSYAPGSNIRVEALAKAFEVAGFKVKRDGYTFSASFDKDTGASSINELPEKLEFAIQALTSVVDLDLKINKDNISKGYERLMELRAEYKGITGESAQRNFLKKQMKDAESGRVESFLMVGVLYEKDPDGVLRFLLKHIQEGKPGAVRAVEFIYPKLKNDSEKQFYYKLLVDLERKANWDAFCVLNSLRVYLEPHQIKTLNEHPSAGNKEQMSRRINFLSSWIIDQGFLYQPEKLLKSSYENTEKPFIPEDFQKELKEHAKVLGLDISGLPMGQRLLDKINDHRQRMFARGAIRIDESGHIIKNPAYEEASKDSPIEQILNHLQSNDDAKIEEMRKIAIVAKTVQNFSSHQVIGQVGRFQVERLVLKAIDEQITFYVLKDPQDGNYYLGFAVLGEFYFNSPRWDLFRGKTIANNELSIKDLEELLSPQNMEISQTAVEWLKSIGSSENAENIFELLKNEDVMTAHDDKYPFKGEDLFAIADVKQPVSNVYFGGVAVNKGSTLARAVLNTDDKKEENFKKGILISLFTEPKDDKKFEYASGVVVTTGAIQSHASIHCQKHDIPGAILYNASYTPEGLSFKVYDGKMQPREFTLGGKSIIYYEFSDYGERTEVVKDGDILYLDVDGSGAAFYVLAKADDDTAQRSYQAFEDWKSGLPGGKKQKKDIEDFKLILKNTPNINLMRAFIKDLIKSGILASSELEDVLAFLIKEKPEVKPEVIGFLRQQTVAAANEFLKGYQEYQQIVGGVDDIAQVYALIASLERQAQELKHMIQTANGTWQSDLTVEKVRDMQRDIISQGISKQKFLQGKAKVDILKVKADGTNSLSSLLRWERKLNMLELSMEDVHPALAKEKESVVIARKAKVNAMKGRGVLTMEQIEDSFAAVLVGAKAAHAAELERIIKILKGTVLDEHVTTPLGFAIQISEYELWKQNGEPEELDQILKNHLALAYRDLVIQQTKELLEFMEVDQRSSDLFKQKIRGRLSKILSLEKLTDLSLIDTFIQNAHELLMKDLEAVDDTDISASFRKKLRVFGALAVRSSSTTEDSEKDAKAGEFETKLNVLGLDNLYKAIIEVWKSGADGILVQEMINAKLSMVGFSADATSKRLDLMTIDAAWGLAKGLVDSNNGVKDPDRYVLDKKGYKIIRATAGKKAERIELDLENGGVKKIEIMSSEGNFALNDKQLQRAAKALDAISKFLGYEIDTEASYDTDDRYVVLQERPITNLRDEIEDGKRILLHLDDNDEKGDSAALSDVGGIDFNPKNLRIKREGRLIAPLSVPIKNPLSNPEIQPTGLTPIIINIVPITNLPLFLGVVTDEQEPQRYSSLTPS